MRGVLRGVLPRLLSCRRAAVGAALPLVFRRHICVHESDPEHAKRPQSLLKTARQGVKLIAPELRKFKDEVVQKLRCDAVRWSEHAEYEVVWRFDTQDSVDRWVVNADHDNAGGRSHARFTLGPNKTGLFHGYVDTTVPKDGITKYMGYCNVNSGKNKKSFMREAPFEWDRYTHLLLRVRGDGRPYQLTLGMQRFFDVQWSDMYTYPLFTRGGPYWQMTAIPFSKFFLAGKGRIQDKQVPIDLLKVISAGITLSDGYTGPFNLEIDFIGVYFDATHTQTFDYELYKVEPYMLY